MAMADEPDETVDKKPKNSKLWILIAVLIFLVTGDLTFRALSYIKGNRQSNGSAPEQAGGKDKAAAPAAKPKKSEVKSTLSLEPFLVNLADKEDVRFVKATFYLGLEDSSSEAAKNPASLAAMRDAIISILTSKTSAQIMTPEGKDKLRYEIRDRVNEVAPKAQVQDVFIVDFVVQL